MLDKLNTQLNDIYYLYCDRGILSLELSIFLNKKGYKTYSIPGGFKKWKEENLK